MSLEGLIVDEYVIKENNYELTKEWFQQFVHGSLEGRWHITETKGHTSIFIMPMVGLKWCLMNVSFSHVYPVESLLQIQFSKPSTPPRLSISIVGMEKWYFIVMVFKAQKSTQSFQLPSFFLTRNMGEEKGHWLSQTMPKLHISITCFSISIFWKYG